MGSSEQGAVPDEPRMGLLRSDLFFLIWVNSNYWESPGYQKASKGCETAPLLPVVLIPSRILACPPAGLCLPLTSSTEELRESYNFSLQVEECGRGEKESRVISKFMGLPSAGPQLTSNEYY